MKTKNHTVRDYYRESKNSQILAFILIVKELQEREVKLTIPTDDHNSLFNQPLEKNTNGLMEMQFATEDWSIRIVFMPSLDDNKDRFVINLKWFNWSIEDETSHTEALPISALDEATFLDKLATFLKGEINLKDDSRIDYVRELNSFTKEKLIELNGEAAIANA